MYTLQVHSLLYPSFLLDFSSSLCVLLEVHKLNLRMEVAKNCILLVLDGALLCDLEYLFISMLWVWDSARLFAARL